MIIDFNSIVEDNEEIKSFKTYNNYLLSFRQCLESTYGKKPEIFKNLKDACESKSAFLKIQTNKKADLNRIKKLLFNSWHTEIVFSIPKQVNVELVKYSNHWAPIQAYYSIFLSLRALFESMGIDCPNTHANTLQQISKCIVDRDLLPVPWNSYHCGLKELNNLTYSNFQKQCSAISNLATPLAKDFWSWYGLWLKTTRDRKYEKRREDLLKGKKFKKANGKPRKNLTIDQKKTVDDGLHATTLFDGLYRLRIRSNYEDADAFILGAMSSNDSVTFYDSLILILQSSLFVIEKSVARYISCQNYEKIVNEFLKNIKGDMAKNTIGLRANYL